MLTLWRDTSYLGTGSYRPPRTKFPPLGADNLVRVSRQANVSFPQRMMGVETWVGGGAQDGAGWATKAPWETVPELNSKGKMSTWRTFQVEGTACINTQ